MWLLLLACSTPTDVPVPSFDVGEGVADGVYLRAGDHLDPLRPTTLLDEIPLLDGGGSATVPMELPVTPSSIAGATALVIVGGRLIDTLEIVPLVASGRRTVGPAESPRPLDPWYTVGARFTDAGGLEPIEVVINPEGRREHTTTGRRVLTLDDRAVPAGRYVLRAPGARRAWVLTFGAPVSAP